MMTVKLLTNSSAVVGSETGQERWIQGDIARYVSRRRGTETVLEEQSSVYAYSGSQFEEESYEEEASSVLDSEAWYWTPEWQEMEREATEDFESGQYEEFSSMDEFVASLREAMSEE